MRGTAALTRLNILSSSSMSSWSRVENCLRFSDCVVGTVSGGASGCDMAVSDGLPQSLRQTEDGGRVQQTDWRR